MSESDDASSRGDPNSDDEQEGQEGQEDPIVEQKVRADTEDEDTGEIDSDEDEEDKLLRDIRVEADPDIEAAEADIGLDIDELSDLETAEDYTDSEPETSDDEEDGFSKLTDDLRHRTIQSYHPDLSTGTDDFVQAKCCVRRDALGLIDDPNHLTLPVLSKYEKTRVLGLRSAQIASGAAPCVDRSGITDPFELAQMELAAKKVPFVIKRPLPGKGCEYWRVSDLES